MKEQLMTEGIIKEENIGYLKSSFNLLQGNLYLTPNRLVLDAHKTGVGGMGLLGALLKKKVESTSYGFNLEFNQIKEIKEGKHGATKGILEITDAKNETFRIMVKSFEDWKNEIERRKS